jgi:hypothetical protein
MCVTVTVVIGHSVALSRRSHLVSTMSSLHDVLVHDTLNLEKNSMSCTQMKDSNQHVLYNSTCS